MKHAKSVRYESMFNNMKSNTTKFYSNSRVIGLNTSFNLALHDWNEQRSMSIK